MKDKVTIFFDNLASCYIYVVEFMNLKNKNQYTKQKNRLIN